ncbi:hypothetical protein M422DRAFT_785854 [Sphaerobolus stellatus SS14]|uniref:DUF6533 domain-containing protein n=1 Tax=Sphaerobolus stellatus (strain SS14) TaxID=990650 RepID=A0A0C9UH53_SPHS4|nr:hypothetical protein M422DRAFT_785854 [Sphaerobolus stellatus SS14]
MASVMAKALQIAAFHSRVSNSMQYAGAVIMLYDSLLSFGDEVRYIWGQQRKGLGFWLYLMSRYGTMAAESTFIAYEAVLPHSPIKGLQGAVVGISNLWDHSLIWHSWFVRVYLRLLRAAHASHTGLLLGRAFVVANVTLVRIMLLLLFLAYPLAVFAIFPFQLCSSSPGPINAYGTDIGKDPRHRHLSCQNVCSPLSERLTSALVATFDTAILFVTLFHTRAPGKLWSWVTLTSSNRLTVLFIKQGIIRFLIIAVWATADSIVTQATKSDLRGFDVPLEETISTILICRFMIQLRKQASQSVVVTTGSVVEQESLSTFQATVRRVHESLEEDFGDPISRSLTEREEGPSEGSSDTIAVKEGSV